MALDFSWQDGDRVLFLGDSITEDPQGYARVVQATVTARYPERLIGYYLHGMGGDRISELSGRLDRDVFDNDPLPNWIILSSGLSDVFHDASGTPIGSISVNYTTNCSNDCWQRKRLCSARPPWSSGKS